MKNKYFFHLNTTYGRVGAEAGAVFPINSSAEPEAKDTFTALQHWPRKKNYAYR
jgi:hypothetical protein